MSRAYKCDVTGNYMDEPENGFSRSGYELTVTQGAQQVTIHVDMDVRFILPGSETNHFSPAVNRIFKKALFEEIADTFS